MATQDVPMVMRSTVWQRLKKEMFSYGWLAAFGSVVVVVAYLLYLKQAIAGYSTPNAITWTVGLITMVVNFATYTYLTDTVAKKAIAFAAMVMTGAVVVYATANKLFVPPTWYDGICFCASIVVGVAWWKAYIRTRQIYANHTDRRNVMVRESKRLNPMIQAIFLISFIPTIIGVCNGQASELFWAWFVATCGYACCAVAEWLTIISKPRAEREYASLPFLLINGIFGNGLVALIALVK